LLEVGSINLETILTIQNASSLEVENFLQSDFIPMIGELSEPKIIDFLRIGEKISYLFSIV